jgi:hypothetical protein
MRKTLALLAFLLAAQFAVPAASQNAAPQAAPQGTCLSPRQQARVRDVMATHPAQADKILIAEGLASPAVGETAFLGGTVGEASWDDTAGGTGRYTMTVGSSVAWLSLGCSTDPDGWKYRSHVSCERQKGSLTTTTNCDWTMGVSIEHGGDFSTEAQVKWKDCAPTTSCTSQSRWGGGEFDCRNQSDCIFDGQDWHIAGDGSVITYTGKLRAKFLTPSPDHTTSWYVACSYWVGTVNHSLGAAGCTGLLRL